ncbi:hypothetical protein [Roseisolibacter sp. H3M3-2]|uniref:hypothetical protein n=1 Tax=Roseisolibacter sp. H3M3-2 TaxID=3031323 RepID=UPI0023DAAE8F|nr:hypothetical protein [Roseisolibacter sp. H3M3-2]MDF1502457.1 hypothetical protein [Roseisolibacter sp. H3M3-2]
MRLTARPAALAAAVATYALLAPAAARAQAAEARVDGIVARDGGVLAGAGLFGDAGLYARLGVVALGGVVRAPGGGAVAAGRLEALARFHIDPLRQSRRGIYAGGGLAAAVRRGGAPAWQLVAQLGAEGRPRGGVAPAVEVGLGGGARVALVLRRARPQRR